MTQLKAIMIATDTLAIVVALVPKKFNYMIDFCGFVVVYIEHILSLDLCVCVCAGIVYINHTLPK